MLGNKQNTVANSYNFCYEIGLFKNLEIMYKLLQSTESSEYKKCKDHNYTQDYSNPQFIQKYLHRVSEKSSTLHLAP